MLHTFVRSSITDHHFLMDTLQPPNYVCVCYAWQHRRQLAGEEYRTWAMCAVYMAPAVGACAALLTTGCVVCDTTV